MLSMRWRRQGEGSSVFHHCEGLVLDVLNCAWLGSAYLLHWELGQDRAVSGCQSESCGRLGSSVRLGILHLLQSCALHRMV